MDRHAVVIGAGVGGLAAGAALHRLGYRVEVHERAASLDPVGSGISVAPNALRALDVLGLGDPVRARAEAMGEGGLWHPSGRRLAVTDTEGVRRAFGDPMVVLHRAELVDVLAAALPPGAVRTSSAVRLVDPGEPGRLARLAGADGEFEADLVVAADGLRSAARSLLFPDHPGPRYSGFTTWRTVIPATGRPVPAGETWGRGALTGAIPLADHRVYLYAAALAPAGGRAADGDERAELLRRFGDWFEPLATLFRSAEAGRVLRHDVWELDRPLPAFHRGRTVLLGDAAHAMTPFQGQGACQAIEDAVVLAHSLATVPDRPGALAAYSAARLPRTTAVATRSRRVARLVALRGGPAVALRNAFLTASARLPEHLLLRGAAPMIDWHPPTAAPPA
ncbi:FAD-dependent monooxygenase [Kitasatospora camelliae]|uniref:FAD-dependent monooxygenase n=1 Tax=Kitasatospora camelliae TaxID=3156397 RepID=A0AAU8K313_9ACTN